VQRPAGIKRLERKFRRLRLYFFQLFYEVTGPRYALHCFVTHVETGSPPGSLLKTGSRSDKFHSNRNYTRYLLAARIILPFSRSQSRSFSASRLSYCFLPLAKPISTFIRPRV
jgi:hypothetical protein